MGITSVTARLSIKRIKLGGSAIENTHIFYLTSRGRYTPLLEIVLGGSFQIEMRPEEAE